MLSVRVVRVVHATSSIALRTLASGTLVRRRQRGVLTNGN